MKSLVLMSYKQPHEGSKFRWGVLQGMRDTKKDPLSPTTIYGQYRKYDPLFKRSRKLATVKTPKGQKAFYMERTGWSLRIPFIGSLVSPFLKSK